jgi:transcription initiation factor IIE alpha subunit
MADISANELARLEALFRETGGAELHDTDVAELAGLDEETCRSLLQALCDAGTIEEPRKRVYVAQPARPIDSAGVRSR